MDQQTVLYDAPGPRARRMTLISSLAATVAIAAAAYFFVYKPLDAREQFSMERWGPLINPSSAEFSPVWTRLWQGFQATLTAAGLAIVISLVFGTLLAMLRVRLRTLKRRRFTGVAAPVGILLRALTWVLSAVTRFFVEVFRGMPVVITIFFVSVVLPYLHVHIDQVMSGIGLPANALLWYLVIGLGLYNSVVIGEILRSGMEGLPPGQREAADAIGLSPFQTIRMILLPQSFRIMLPALIGQLVVVLKDTSLGFIIGYEEALRVASQLIQAVEHPNPIQTYVVIGVIFILVNYSLSKLAGYTQRRLARGRKTALLKAGGAASAAPPSVLAEIAVDKSAAPV